MGFNNFLTSYKVPLLKHIRSVFTFQATHMAESEIKLFVDEMTTGAVPIPQESFEWLATMFRYIGDKNRMLSYDNVKGIWTIGHEIALQNVLTDYFTIIYNEAETYRDAVMMRYAKYFFSSYKLPTLANRIKTAIGFFIPASADLYAMTDKYRYFDTENGRALLDMTSPTFNLKEVTFAEVRPLMLTHLSPVPIKDEEPVLWLQLIKEYMLNDPERIEYFEKVLAYMMSPYNYNQVFLYFIGGGRNGKGTIIKVIQDILGSHSVRLSSELLNAKPSPSFKKDDALASTEGRSLYIFNEIDERMIASTQNIKDLTEGGRDEFNNKIMTVVRPAYSPNYEINICGTPVIIANNLLNFGDWSVLDPIFKRLILVSFDYIIPVEDPSIPNRLAAEYPQIQAWLYRNYFKHKGIQLKSTPKPKLISDMVVSYRNDSDIIGMFWKSCIEVTYVSTDEVQRSALYKMYTDYCKANGRLPIRNTGTNGFSNLIKPMIDKFVVHRNGTYYVQCIKATSYYMKEVNV